MNSDLSCFADICNSKHNFFSGIIWYYDNIEVIKMFVWVLAKTLGEDTKRIYVIYVTEIVIYVINFNEHVLACLLLKHYRHHFKMKPEEIKCYVFCQEYRYFKKWSFLWGRKCFQLKMRNLRYRPFNQSKNTLRYNCWQFSLRFGNLWCLTKRFIL